jgi:hypothetical protein
MQITRADEEISRLVGRCVTWWKMRLQAQAAARELDALGDKDLEMLAQDLALSTDELRDLAADGKGSELMERMLRAYGLSIDVLRTGQPDLVRDMAVACARCADKGRCSHDLDAGTAREHAAGYCPNVPTFEALQP